MLTICIIEDIPEINEGLVDLLEKDHRFSIIGNFTTAEKAMLEIPQLMPDIVISDINLPDKSGIDALKYIKNLFPQIQFIMFTIYEDSDQVFDALKSGASGYILKNTTPNKIIESIIELSEGGSPMSPSIARKVINTFNSNLSSKKVENLLTHREFEVLELLSKGFLYKEIADQLSISISTVKRHINHIYEKLQVQNKTEAVNKLYGK
ncbi:response regulator transcription factor [Flavobacterium sp.]|uniref:response regulator transcription factor n=1 Tax=Flavobacterium sp. TaxID=239 RepID=UPI002B4B5595|nr:response regulator transcription factor [Flavobacterium sp.]HLP64825.1 response regulator transcription factor [Flavobacterium sp.]